MPGLVTKLLGSGDYKWLLHTHGIRDAVTTGTIDVSTFTKATHYPDGYLRSGTEVNVASESAVKPWTGAAGEKLGYILTDQPTDGVADFGAPILRHGLVKTARLPIAHVNATNAADAAGFTFISEAGA